MQWLDDPDTHDIDPFVRSTIPNLKRLRVLVADESRLVSESLMFTLDSDPKLDAIGYALDATETLDLIADLEPDVVLLGPTLTALQRRRTTRLLHALWPRLLIIVLCQTLVPVEVEAVYAAGATDCLPQSRSADELLHAIGTAHARLVAFDRGRLHADRRQRSEVRARLTPLHLVESENSDD
jgi:DNA-binding NarL/FixJ family response regulator